LAESSALEEDHDAQKLASLKKEIDSEDQDPESAEKGEKAEKDDKADKDDAGDKVGKREKAKASKKNKETPKKKELKPVILPKKEAPSEPKPEKKISLSTDAESVIDQVVESSYDTGPKPEKKEQPTQSLAAVEPAPEPVKIPKVAPKI